MGINNYQDQEQKKQKIWGEIKKEVIMPHSKSITSDYRDFKNKNIIGVVTNTQCSGIGGGGGQR